MLLINLLKKRLLKTVITDPPKMTRAWSSVQPVFSDVERKAHCKGVDHRYGDTHSINFYIGVGSRRYKTTEQQVIPTIFNTPWRKSHFCLQFYVFSSLNFALWCAGGRKRHFFPFFFPFLSFFPKYGANGPRGSTEKTHTQSINQSIFPRSDGY